jgi:hypothetical protein
MIEDEDDELFIDYRLNDTFLKNINFFDLKLRSEDLTNYINSIGVAKFYSDVTKYKIDKLIVNLFGWSTIELFKIIDEICTLIIENHAKFIFVNNQIILTLKQLDGRLVQNILILQGIREWFTKVELDENDLGIKQISDFVQSIHEDFISKYCWHEFNNPKHKLFEVYMENTWMMPWMLDAAEHAYGGPKVTELIMSWIMNKPEKLTHNTCFSNVDSSIEEIKYDIPEKKFPTIDVKKYKTDEIFRLCDKRKIFKCTKEVFDNFLVFGFGNNRGEKIKWIYMNGNKSQLRTFLRKLTGVNVEPITINKMFDVEKLDSNNNSTKLNEDLLLILTLSHVKIEK